MKIETFLSEVVERGGQFPAGLVSFDIQGHANLVGSDEAIANTRDALRDLVFSQILDAHGAVMSWAGDGGYTVFHTGNGVEEMLQYAERILYLIPMLNHAQKSLNKLPYQQEIAVRIVCHAGILTNPNGEPGSIQGDTLNDLAHNERMLAKIGHVVISSAVFNQIADYDLRGRFQPHVFNEQVGQTYALNAHIGNITIRENDSHSTQLRQWISDMLESGRYHELLYVGYTNERLFDFLVFTVGHQFEDMTVRILVRNWLVEQNDERDFEQALGSESDMYQRPWRKSKIMQAMVDHLNAIDLTDTSLEVRYYDSPPLFNGAILIDNVSGAACAHMGLVEWEARPHDGGSPYKLREWEAIQLDGRYELQARLVRRLRSRFDHDWERAYTLDEVSSMSSERAAAAPAVIDRFWKLDGLPYLLVYPTGTDPNRPYPSISTGDLKAFTLIDDFLKQYHVRTEHFRLHLPLEIRDPDWYPEGRAEDIEEWDGHVIYICTRSIPPTMIEDLLDQGFPFQILGVGTEEPCLRYVGYDIDLYSPLYKDVPEPEPIDYGLLARVRRSGKNSHTYAYFIAGLRSLGTWGIAHFVTNHSNIAGIVRDLTEENVAMVVEAHFDKQNYDISRTNLLLGPHGFEIKP